MVITFQGERTGRSLTVRTEGASVRITIQQDSVISGLALDVDTAVALAASVAQAAKKVAR